MSRPLMLVYTCIQIKFSRSEMSMAMAEVEKLSQEHLHTYYTWAMPFRELYHWLNSNKGMHNIQCKLYIKI